MEVMYGYLGGRCCVNSAFIMVKSVSHIQSH